jgi:membrane-bound ClpP family serine protease
MLLDYFSLSRMSLGGWDQAVLRLTSPGPNLFIIAGVIVLLIFLAGRLRGFWGFVVYLISGGVILICLKNIMRLW